MQSSLLFPAVVGNILAGLGTQAASGGGGPTPPPAPLVSSLLCPALSGSLLAGLGTQGGGSGPGPSPGAPLFESLLYPALTGGLLGGLGTQGVAPVAPNLTSALRARFRSAALLAELTEVFNREAETGQAYPFLVINQIGEDAVPVTYSPTYPAWAEFQFCVVDDKPARGEALRDAAFLELAPVVKPRLVFADGKDSGGRIPGRKWEIRQPGPGRQGRWTWAFFFGYRFYLTRYWTPRTNP